MDRKWYDPRLWTAKALDGMRHMPAGISWIRMPGTKFDYGKEVEHPLLNSAVAATVFWAARAFTEAPLELWERDESAELSIVEAAEVSRLVRRPNPSHSGTLLWHFSVIDLLITGNAYWLKVGNAGGKPVQLWPIPSAFIEPKGETNTSENFIKHYEYNPLGDPEEIDPGDVVHIRYGIDPDNMRKGLSPLGSLLREIFTDNEAGNFSATLLRNFGVPGFMITPEDGSSLNAEKRKEMRTRWQSEFGGDNRGNLMIGSGKVKLEKVSFSPQEMDLGKLRQIPEERVTAVLGIPAAVVGLGTGLEQTKVGATMAEMRELAWENCIIPLQRMIAEQLETQLLVDFRPAINQVLDFDLRHVRVLQDDQDKLIERLDKAVARGWLKVSEAQAAAGFSVDDTQDGYLRDTLRFSLVKSGEETEAQEAQETEMTEGAEADLMDPGETVQQLALNGAQISSMLEVIQQVTQELIGPDTARALLTAAFPALASELIERMVASAETFEPALEAAVEA